MEHRKHGFLMLPSKKISCLEMITTKRGKRYCVTILAKGVPNLFDLPILKLFIFGKKIVALN